MSDNNQTNALNWAQHSAVSIHVNVTTQLDLLNDLKARLTTAQGFTVATLNLDHVVKLRNDEPFRTAYGAHTHVTADGNPIVWLSHLAGQSDISLVPGSELIDPIARLAEDLGVPVGFFGATETSLTEAAHAMRTTHPNLEVALTKAPKMGFDPTGAEAMEAIDAIRDSGAKIVFLALGAPKQERFAAFAQTKLPDVGFLSIGAGLDFISGSQKRAPALVRTLALEWLWRLFGNPRRLAARYAGCFAILPALIGTALRQRRARNGS